jgi:hypothetical protein
MRRGDGSSEKNSASAQRWKRGMGDESNGATIKTMNKQVKELNELKQSQGE